MKAPRQALQKQQLPVAETRLACAEKTLYNLNYYLINLKQGKWTVQKIKLAILILQKKLNTLDKQNFTTECRQSESLSQTP